MGVSTCVAPADMHGRSHHGLSVVGRVKVAVVEDDHVSRGEVDAEAPRAGGNEEDADVLVLLELVDQRLPRAHRRAAVKADEL